MSGPVTRRRLVRAAAGGAAAVAAASAGWITVDLLERDNDFCNACHLEPGLPLHIEIRRDFDQRPAASLAGLHAAAARDGGQERDFRCIDCHGGTGPYGRLRVKVLAAKDAFWYVVGRFEEPDAMSWPIWDEDCGKCHMPFDTGHAEPWRTPRFHQLPVHNVELGVSCVECHRTHDRGGDPNAYFLRAPWVRTQCARCHSDFEEDAG
jgi:hypothetical protein